MGGLGLAAFLGLHAAGHQDALQLALNDALRFCLLV
jgi:hypothetical protein